MRTDSVIKAAFRRSYISGFTLDVDLTLPGRGITVLFGESGSGKTTLLRCMAGLQPCEDAFLSVNGQVWHSGRHSLAVHKRAVGYVFQEASLFPHLTAKGNLDYAAKRCRKSNKGLFNEVVELMGLSGLLERTPDRLSGGERQRVAIARALLTQPRLLLLDEPLASLDEVRKREILPFLERLHESIQAPVVYVTHSLDEVARLADYLVVLEAGRVKSEGSVTDVLSQTEFALKYADKSGTVLEAVVTEIDEEWKLSLASFQKGGLWIPASSAPLGKKLRLRIQARDVSISLTSHRDSSIQNRLPATVDEINSLDESMALVRLRLGDEYLFSRITQRAVNELSLAVGQNVWAQVKSVALLR